MRRDQNGLGGLRRIGNRYYAFASVPRALWAVLKTKEVRKSLGTSDWTEARRRLPTALLELHAGLRDAAKPPTTTPALTTEAAAFREALASARSDDEFDALEIAASDRADSLEERSGLPVARRWYRAATQKHGSLADHLKAWNDSSEVVRGTKSQREQGLNELAAALGTDADLLVPEDLTSDASVLRVVDHMAEKNLARVTRKHRISALSGLLSYLQDRLIIPRTQGNPWATVRLPREPRDRVRKRAFKDAEVVKLMNPPDAVKAWPLWPALRDLMVLSAFTGARREELASLAAEQVALARNRAVLSIRAGKTGAATREIPVVNKAALRVLKRRTEGAKDGRLFPELRKTPSQDKYGQGLTVAFMNLRAACKLPTDVDLHSFRRYVATRLDRAGVDYLKAARFLGHSVPTLMHRVYSAGLRAEDLDVAARALVHGKEVERAMDRASNLR
jgi:integrase